MKNKKGFSLMEVVMILVIVGILSIIAVPVYKKYVQRAVETEARAMLEELAHAQDMYLLKNKDSYYGSASSLTASDSNLGVDFKKNKYFTAFKVVSAD